MANFPGTNIPLSSFKGSDSKKEELINRLNQDMSAGDIQGMNDAIFDVAYHSVGGQGQGQGNANVSKIHHGIWKVTSDVGANTSWAEDNINSEGDKYIQKDGSVIEFSDTAGVLKDNVSTGSWGGWDNTEFNRDTGEKNIYFKDDPKVDLPAVGTTIDTSIYTDVVTSGDPSWIPTQSGNNTTSLLGNSGAVDLAAYRPWTQNYWDTYVPKASQGLLKTGKPQRDYGLAYLPGEMRDPVNWAAGSGAGGTGHIPGGGWRFSDTSYTTQTNPATGQPYATGNQPHAPWRFTSGDAQASNIYNTPWSAKSMNLNKAQGGDWTSFLSSIDTSPTITPGLLGTKKGGPINFGT